MSIYTHTYQVKETEVPIIIPDEKNKSEISSKKNLKNRLTTGTVALLIALLAVVSATYAWYVYNTGRHTTKVRMAAGAGVNLQISNSYSGTYGSAAVLDSFTGRLNPVSTNRISGGFQKVIGFTNGTENQSNLVASLFGRGDYTDYYKTSLFLRTNGNPTDIYIADIGKRDKISERRHSVRAPCARICTGKRRQLPEVIYPVDLCQRLVQRKSDCRTCRRYMFERSRRRKSGRFL